MFSFICFIALALIGVPLGFRSWQARRRWDGANAMGGTIASRKTLLILLTINGAIFLYLLRADVQNEIDFKAFYSGGGIARQTRDHIYDLHYQLRWYQSEFNTVKFGPFFHPPHELLLFLPLSKLPYPAALIVWRILSLACLLLSGVLLARVIGGNILDTVLLVAAIYTVPMCLAMGQDSLLLLLFVCTCFYMLRKDWDIASAIVLALALFKPQLPMVLAVAALAAGKRRFFAWFAVFGSVLAAGSMIYVGWTGVSQMIQALQIGVTGSFGVATMPNVRGLVAFAFRDSRWFALAMLTGSILAMIPVWRRARSLEFAIASATCLASAMAFYIYPYDLVVLAVPLVLTSRHPRQRDVAVAALVTSGPLWVFAYLVGAPCLMLFPTLALGWTTFKLKSVTVRETAYAQASA